MMRSLRSSLFVLDLCLSGQPLRSELGAGVESREAALEILASPEYRLSRRIAPKWLCGSPSP
jgi:hypothetical protein